MYACNLVNSVSANIQGTQSCFPWTVAIIQSIPFYMCVIDAYYCYHIQLYPTWNQDNV